MSNRMNMLRTRRKDCNVKPNRRLDRKSSRGMLYENEELRLKTININAEVESRQSDIKKLKRENEMLKKGLWYLRDEYDKLERLIKEKNIGLSSPSTCSTSNDSESCSSCSEEGDSDEVETEQNIQNVQRTNLRNMHDKFEQLSVVTEEASGENSEHSAQKVSPPISSWNDFETDVIQPDQSYPDYSNIDSTKKLSTEEKSHYCSQTDSLNNFEVTNCNQIPNEMVYPDYYNSVPFTTTSPSLSNIQHDEIANTDHSEEIYRETFQKNLNDEFPSQPDIQTTNNNFQQNLLAPSIPEIPTQVRTMQKSLTDIIVKIDNQNFNKDCVFSNTPSQSTFSNGGNLEELLKDIESVSMEILKMSSLQRNMRLEAIHDRNCSTGEMTTQTANKDVEDGSKKEKESVEKAYTSELNVVLLPNPMPLITFDKYKHLQKSFENVNEKNVDNTSASQQDLYFFPPAFSLPKSRSAEALKIQSAPVIQINTGSTDKDNNPFLFGNFKDNYVDGNFFRKYNPNYFTGSDENKKSNLDSKDKLNIKFGSKSNICDVDRVSNEEDANTKADCQPNQEYKNCAQSKENLKSPSMSLRKKVSIHFKGKMKKTNNMNSDSSIPNSSNNDKKQSTCDVRFMDQDKNKINHQKTPSIDSKKSTTETSYNQEPKTTSSSESKHSNEKKMSISGRKDNLTERKLRKSVSVSPERGKHHMHEEGTPKKHKKHRRSRMSRANIQEPRSFRERSFSVCTDRSVPLDHRLSFGFGLGSSVIADDHSDRERTNSLSSCDTADHARKFSTFSNVNFNGKVPWCGCWGNGCL